jgi:hypothetical protein
MPRWLRLVFVATVVLLAFTGFGQMPLYGRYYLTSLPALGWAGDFYFTHLLHYAGAAVLLGLMAYVCVRYGRVWVKRSRLTPSGWLRVALYAGLVASGVLRVLKNQPDIFFTPLTVLAVDWVHLGLAMLLGITALVVRLMGRGAYLAPRR